MLIVKPYSGQGFYIHPLDISVVKTFEMDNTEYTFCTASFSVLGFNTESQDMILGDVVLRNAYTA